MAQPIRIQVYVEGGLVQDIHMPDSLEHVAIDVIDLDVDGSDGDRICDCPMSQDRHFHGCWFDEVRS